MKRSSRWQGAAMYCRGSNLWSRKEGGILIGSYELPENLNAVGYLQFLENELVPLLYEVPLEVRHQLYLQLDGASPHYAQIV